MKNVTLTSIILFLFLTGKFTFAQQNCDPQALCENAIELIFDADLEGVIECDTLPDMREGQTLNYNSCNSNIEKNSVYFESHCITPNLQVVWYKFNTGNHEYTDVKVQKNGNNPIKTFGIDIYEYCQHYSAISNCDFAGLNDNEASFRELKLEKYTDYYIAIGSKLQDTGSFEIKLDVYNKDNSNFCTNDPAVITPNKLPPYNTGDTIIFDVYVPIFDQTSVIEWAQGFIPVFGPGWDINSFESLGGEPTTRQLPNSNWSWWAEGEIYAKVDIHSMKTYYDELGRLNICFEGDCPDSNEGCLVESNPLPAGWYAYQDGGGLECVTGSGDPNLGWGDGFGPWDFSFSLVVGDPGTQTLDGETDLGVEMFVFSDLHTGCWNPPSVRCRMTPPGINKAFNNNCNNPAISAGEDIVVACAQEAIEIIGTGPVENNFIQYWGTVDGEIIGSNDSYNLSINATGRYRMFLEDTITGCVTYDDVNVIYEITDLGFEVNNIACKGEVGGSAGVNSGGQVEWSNGETGNEISDLEAGFYSVTITEGDCVRTLEFEVTEPETELTITSEQVVDFDNGTITIDIEGGVGEYEIEWFYNGSPIASGVTELTVFEEGTYLITVKDENDCIKSITVDILFPTSVITFEGSEKIRAYPNPVNNILFLEGESVADISSFEIISVTGQTVKVGRDGIQSGQINVANLSPGQYILRLITVEGNPGILKFIKD